MGRRKMTDYFDLVTSVAKQNNEAVRKFTEAFKAFIEEDDELMRAQIECFKLMSALLKKAIGGEDDCR